MLYFAISPSAINPHCGGGPASALACLPQVGIQLGAGAISFSATVCPLQSFVRSAGAVPAEKTAGSWEILKKNKGGRGRDVEEKMVDGRTDGHKDDEGGGDGGGGGPSRIAYRWRCERGL